MKLTLKIWRQRSRDETGAFQTYELDGVSEHMSFLEMLDFLNEKLIEDGEEPVAFDHDCREGICGSCGVVIDGAAHGPMAGTATCQLHMRHYNDGDVVKIEPFRARSFPVVRDLVVDRSPFDKIIQAGGYISVNTGSACEANLTPVPKPAADRAMDAAECIGCGACVAQCPNGAAQLFTSAKISHLGNLPQGQPERYARAARMVDTMEEYFGSCSNFRDCEAVCPKGISVDFIAQMNRDYLKSKFSR